MIFPTSSRQFLIEFVAKNIIFFSYPMEWLEIIWRPSKQEMHYTTKDFNTLDYQSWNISLTGLKDKSDCFKTSILQFYQMFEVNNWMQNMKKNVWIKYMDWKCIEIRSHPDINLTKIRSWLGIKKSPNPSKSAHNQTTQWDYPMRLLNETTNEITQWDYPIRLPIQTTHTDYP